MSLMDDLLASDNWSPTNFLGTSLTLGADQTYNTPKSAMTQASTAVDLMAPNTATGPMGEWGQFFLDSGKALLGYAVAKDAQQSGVQAPVRRTDVQPQGSVMNPNYAPRGGMELGGMLPLLLLGAVVLLVAKD